MQHIYSLVSFIIVPCSQTVLQKNKIIIKEDCQTIVSELHFCADSEHQGNQRDLHCSITVDFLS